MIRQPEAAAPEADDAGSGAVGIYKLVEVQSDDDDATTQEDVALMEAMGFICYIELTEDGQAVLSMFGEEMTGTWQDGAITMEGEAAPFVLEGDTLTVSQDDTALVFTRTDPETIAAAQENDFLSGLSGLEDFGEYAETSELTAARSEVEYFVDGEGVLIDNDACKVTVTGYDPDGDWGFTVKLCCENKTEDQTLWFHSDEVRVNGYSVDPYWGCTVAPGKLANENLELDNSSLDEAGIASVDEIIVPLVIDDDDTWERVAVETVALYPTGLTAEDIVIPDRQTTEDEQVIVENDDIVFVILGVEEDGFWGYTLKAYLENKTDDEVYFGWDDVSVNDIMVDPYWGTSVAPHARAYSEISFYDTDFEENGIETVDEIEFTLAAHRDNDNWDEILEEIFTYTPAP